jgi:HSP20 family protein
MTLPRAAPSSWIESLDIPNRLFESRRDDYELYEEDDEFVLRLELPGYDPEEMTVTWDDGVLNIAAEHEDEARGQRKTYHRRFRFPKTVDNGEIAAEYTNGVLEIRLPIVVDGALTGSEIEIES